MRKLYLSLLMCILSLVTSQMRASTTKFYAQDFFVEPGQEVEFQILFDGDVYVTQAQFSLEIPSGFEFVNKGTERRPVYGSNTDDSQGLTWASNISGQVLTATLQDATQVGTEDYSGVLAVVYIKAKSDITAGVHTFKLTNMVASDENAGRYPSDNQDVKATVTKDCNITIGVNNADFGSATLDPVAGTYKSGKQFTATATPKTGYKFVKWSNGSTENPYTFTLEDDLNLKAEFEILKYNIVFYQEDGTTKIEEKTYDYNAAITAPDAPNKEGWSFKAWDPAVPTNALADGEYKATYTKNKYTVKFVKEDGTTVVKEEVLEYGATITAPDAPTKEGYTFKAWNPAVDATVPAKDVLYKATYDINQYTVKFVHPKDGSTIKEEILDFGATITAPTAPDWTGHTFLGWTPEVDATVPAKDVTYTADYDAETYNITYMVNEQEWKTEAVKFEFTLPEDPTPEVEGYNFKGWTWSTGDKPATMPANNITATAVLEIKTNTVKFFEEDGTTQIGSDFTGVYNSDITAPTATTKTGYTFDGWTIIGGDDTVLATVTKIPGDNTNYQAHYTVNKHKITYKVDGEVYQEVPDVEYGTTLVAIDAPQDREGYTFSGWSEFASATMPDEDVIVTGTFNINQYTITFVTLDESGSVKETIQSTTQDYATAIVAPDETDAEVAAKLDRINDGWIFKGWALASDPLTKVEVAATVPATDLTYVAYYVPNIVNVIYIVDGDTLTTVTVDYQAALPEDPAPEKEGHTFSGWTTWRNELATVTYEEKPATMPAENVVAEGSFIVNQYCVTFISDNAIVSEEWINYGAPIVAPTNPEKIGHDFTGWAPALPATVPARDLTFYAQFTPLTYTIIYMVDGEEYQRVNTPFGANITPLVVEKEGYTFSGWANLPETMPARNVRATGSLTINQYQVTFMDNENIVKEEMLDFGAEIVAPEAPAHEGFNFVRWENLLETVPANDVVFTAVYEIIEDITPVEEEVKLDFAKDLLNEAGEPIALNNAVVKNTYYNFDPAKGDTYDTDEKCLVLSTSTTENQMEEVVEEALGSSNMAQNFAGLILSVKGEGTIEIDCQTFGNKELFVKVGDNEPKVFKKIERGLAEVAYNAAENTPVYIYASSSTGIETADDALKIWSVNIVPGSSTPVSIKALREAIEKGTCYTIDGRKLNTIPTKKGFYIINGKKVMIK